jgi:hypothetical protein
MARGALATLAAAAAVVAVGAALAACGKEPQKTPAACLAGSAAYFKALEAAPRGVRLEARTRISDCLPAEQDAGPLADVGETMIVVATRLNHAGRTGAGTGGPALEAGYLVGAVSVGVAKTGGIHGDLLRRLEAAARYDVGEPLSPSFRRDYARGYAAGRRNG